MTHRISQIFQSSNNAQESVSAAPSAAAPSASEPSANAPSNSAPSAPSSAFPEIGYTDGNEPKLLDQLRPMITEIVNNALLDEEKLLTDVKQFNLESALRKLPLLPKIAHRLPEPVKKYIKKVLDSIDGAKTNAADSLLSDIRETISQRASKNAKHTSQTPASDIVETSKPEAAAAAAASA